MAVQLRLALLGPSGSGKSTAAGMLQECFAEHGLVCSVHKLAKPLYDIKQMFYEVSGNPVAYDAQDHPLMEQIARNLRELSPRALVDNLQKRLTDCADDVILNDDLRDDVVDWPALVEQGFKIVRIFAPDHLLIDRLKSRGDLRLLAKSPLDDQMRKIRSDYVLVNDGEIKEFRKQVGRFVEMFIADNLTANQKRLDGPIAIEA